MPQYGRETDICFVLLCSISNSLFVDLPYFDTNCHQGIQILLNSSLEICYS